jgi:poly(A)-specific ribonuclease
LSADGVDLKLDRKFSFSSSACDFLNGCGFDFGKVFSTGVPYLSGKEEAELLEEFERRSEKNKKIPDITIPLSDSKALEFYENARLRIRGWLDDTNVGTCKLL